MQRFRLANGLTIVALVDRSAPVISYHTWFRVGSRHEQPGKTGLAHLFEHLMFNETQSLPAGMFDRTLEAAGGDTNAATWVDWTFYYANLPSSELPLIVELEADRMAQLVLRKPQLVSEKDVVINERYMRVDDDVEGAVNEQLYATAFKRHPYHWPTIGWMEDIRGFTVRDCERFYRTFYAPNNAVVVVVGDFEVDTLLSLIQARYGELRAAKLPREAPVKEPAQRRERHLVMHRATPTPKLQLGYRGPAFEDPDHAVLSVVNELLFGGRSSRLYGSLIRDREVASDARGALAPFRDPGLYEIWVSMRRGHGVEEALQEIDAGIEALHAQPVPRAELDKVKNRLELGFLQGLETACGKAEQIGFCETVVGDPGLIFRRLEEIRAVTPADVQRVSRRYLTTKQRTRITVLPREEEAAA